MADDLASILAQYIGRPVQNWWHQGGENMRQQAMKPESEILKDAGKRVIWPALTAAAFLTKQPGLASDMIMMGKLGPRPGYPTDIVGGRPDLPPDYFDATGYGRHYSSPQLSMKEGMRAAHEGAPYYPARRDYPVADNANIAPSEEPLSNPHMEEFIRKQAEDLKSGATRPNNKNENIRSKMPDIPEDAGWSAAQPVPYPDYEYIRPFSLNEPGAPFHANDKATGGPVSSHPAHRILDMISELLRHHYGHR